MRIALAQLNVTVGDIEGNVKKIVHFFSQAAEIEADVVVFPELCVCGYPPEDLLLKSYFIEDNHLALEQIAKGLFRQGHNMYASVLRRKIRKDFLTRLPFFGAGR